MAIEQESFPLISGHLSFDLVNTEVVRHGIRHNLLETEQDVEAWVNTLLAQTIIYTEQLSEDVTSWAREALPILHKLRSLLREGFERIADGGNLPNGWTSQLESHITNAPFSYKINKGKLMPVPLGKPVYALTSLISLDALELLATGELTKTHRCANPDCVLLFMDTSGRRKWCSMKICGNRKKVARFQKRHQKK
ncbi:CGNR zinc finger domain-containing protein [Bacillus sp. V3B]|uniref:CGNR zinc finger domain-containing protein n=1 Tax=Bacillus sp. V3B TaxID=2804915 RepID=UPI00210B8DCE|nr:CGNR zinc finger domain-containing protein [Bacillus sp. V3B]MCQ6275897.1 CGNR zinc finger domain-containing protein [Bacillus sp. V3B]